MYLHIYYFRIQQGAFIVTEETESVHTSSVAEVGEAIASAQAAGTTAGMCHGHPKLRFTAM